MKYKLFALIKDNKDITIHMSILAEIIALFNHNIILYLLTDRSSS